MDKVNIMYLSLLKKIYEGYIDSLLVIQHVLIGIL
jgi:hypothetical protein